ncbi:MAG: 30S ribosomal protein S3, partial [Eubacteriales bacterium]|nr:30S ribosomal protein S3 [Eubacteriales bacterium]
DLARSESYKEGKVTLHTLRANIEYGFAEARTVAGKVGVKVWICRLPTNDKEKKEGGRRAAFS